MARRPKESDALTREELAALRQQLAHLSAYDVERFYRTAYERCVLQLCQPYLAWMQEQTLPTASHPDDQKPSD